MIIVKSAYEPVSIHVKCPSDPSKVVWLNLWCDDEVIETIFNHGGMDGKEFDIEVTCPNGWPKNVEHRVGNSFVDGARNESPIYWMDETIMYQTWWGKVKGWMKKGRKK